MAQETLATVTSISGRAQARNADGELRELRVGDELRDGETVVTPDGGTVQLTLSDGSPLTVDGVSEMAITPDLVGETATGADESAVEDETVQQVLVALESGEDLGDILPPAAAGSEAASGLEGEGHSWVRLGRILLDTDEFTGIVGSGPRESVAVLEENLIPVDAVDDAATTDEGVPVIIDVQPNDDFQLGSNVIAVTDGAHGTVVINADNTVTYTPEPGFFGTDVFTYTALSADGNGQDTANVTVVIEGEPPAPPPEVPPTIFINDDVVVEGETATLTISLSKPWTEPVTVQYRTNDDTAVAPGDYDPVTGLVTITFAPGETSIEVTFSTNVDNLEESREQFLVNLSNPTNATIADDTGIVEIIDDFTPPSPPPPPPPPPGELSIAGGASELDEEKLENGTQPDLVDGKVTKTGSFTVTAEDGLFTLKVTNSEGDLLEVVADGDFKEGETITEGPITITFDTMTGPDADGVYTINVTAELTGTFAHTELGEDSIELSLTLVATDNRGQESDPATRTLTVIDDVPDSQLSDLGDALVGELVWDGEFPTLNVDETEGLDAENEDTDNIDRQSSADFSGFFLNDEDGSIDGAENDVIFGADGPGSVDYGLSLKISGSDEEVPAEGLASGLYAVDASQPEGRGEQIFLTQVGDTIEGRAGGVLYFTISGDGAGNLTLQQELDDGESPISIWHPDSPDAHDDVVSLDGSGDQSAYGDGLIGFEINLTQTVKDSEGDFDKATVNLAAALNVVSESGVAYAFNFGDDGPTATSDGSSLVEPIQVEEGNTYELIISEDDFGADGGHLDAGVSLDANVDPAIGEVAYDGAGKFTFTPDANSEGGKTSFTYTLTDADGDTSQVTVYLDVVADTVPVAQPESAFVDDDGLEASNIQPDVASDDDPDVDPDNDESTYSGTFSFNLGGDTPASKIDFQKMEDDGVTDTIGQETVSYDWNAGTSTLMANIVGGARDGQALFKVVVDNVATGAYTVTLLQNVMHLTLDDQAGDNTENNTATANLQYTVFDSDGSPASAALVIDFDDDIPEPISGGTSGNPIEVAEGDTYELDITAAMFGADGGDLDAGVAIVTNVDPAIGEVAYDGAGKFTFTPADDAAGGETQFTYSMTDADGDTIEATVYLDVAGDTKPVAQPESAFVDDDGLEASNIQPDVASDDDPDVDPDNDESTYSGTFSFNLGGDTPASKIDFQKMEDDGVTDTIGQETVSYDWNAGTSTLMANIVGGARDGQALFKVVVDNVATGAYTVTLLQNVMHLTLDDQAGDNTENNTATANLQYTVFDSDGSPASAALVIDFDDDIPEPISGGTSGNPIEVAEGDTYELDITAAMFGADGGDLDAGVAIVTNVDPAIGEVAYDGAGKFTFTPADDAAGGETQFTYSMTDADGDTIEATVYLDVAGDTKPVAQPESAFVDDDGLEASNIQPDVASDDDPDVDPDNDESTYSGTFSFNLGGDTPASKIDFQKMEDDGVTDTIGQETVSYDWNAGTSTLMANIVGGARDGQALFKVVVDNVATGAYTVTLLQNVMHLTLDDQAGDNTENNTATANLQYTVFDSDGSPASAALVIDFDDDIPEPISGGTSGNPIEVAEGDTYELDITAAMFGADGGDLDAGVAIVTNVDPAIGEVAYDGAGKFTFTPADDAAGGETQFTYSMTDADGDTIEATVYLDVAGDTKPVAQPESAFVDDDGLEASNIQPDVASDDDPDVDPDNDESTYSGTFSFNLGGDTPASKIDFQKMEDDGVTDTIGQETVSYDWNAGTSTLMANIVGGARDGQALFKVVVDNVATGAYTVTLLQNVMHLTLDDQAGDNTENNTATANLQYTVFDSDGSPASAALVIDFDDDIPEPISGGTSGNPIEVAEGDTYELDITAAMFGADGGDLDAGVAIVTNVDPAIGEVAYDGAGKFTFTPADDAAGGETQFTYSMTDADGDTIEATVYLDVAGDTKPVAQPESAFVDDDGLEASNIQPDVASDDDPDVDPDNDESTYSGTFSFNLGGDTPASKIDFQKMEDDGVTDTIGQETVSYDWNAGTSTLMANIVGGARDGQALFKVVVDNVATGAYTVTLLQNVMHLTLDDQAGDNTENNTATANLQYTVFDSDGSPASAALVIDFDDDIPEVGDFVDFSVPNSIATTAGSTNTGFLSGADNWSDITVTGEAITGLTYLPLVVNTDGDGNVTSVVLTGEETTGGDDVFTYTVFADGQQSFELLKPEASSTVLVNLDNLKAGGPVGVRELIDGTVEFEGSGVNVSSPGIGIGNNHIDASTNDVLTIEFFKDGTGTDANDTLSAANQRLVGSVSFTENHRGGTYSWVVYNTVAGTSESGTVTMGSGDPFTIDPGIDFDRIVMEATEGSMRPNNMSYTEKLLPDGENITFDVTGIDGDGDATSTDQVTVTVLPGEASAVAPASFGLAAPVEEDSAPETVVQTATAEADTLLATDDADVFAWSLADNTSQGDLIVGFDAEADAINIADILGDSVDTTDFASYLDVSLGEDGASTVIKVSNSGDFENAEQTITVQDVNLVAGVDLDDSAALATALQNLVDAGKLITE